MVLHKLHMKTWDWQISIPPPRLSRTSRTQELLGPSPVCDFVDQPEMSILLLGPPGQGGGEGGARVGRGTGRRTTTLSRWGSEEIRSNDMANLPRLWLIDIV